MTLTTTHEDSIRLGVIPYTAMYTPTRFHAASSAKQSANTNNTVARNLVPLSTHNAFFEKKHE